MKTKKPMMKKNTSLGMRLLVFFLLSFQLLYAQSVGDFKSKNYTIASGVTGAWNQYTTWDIYTVSGWQPAISGQYPGATGYENTNVTISCFNPTKPVKAVGSYIIGKNLIVYGGLDITGNFTLSSAGGIDVTIDGGTIKWSGNGDFILSPQSTVSVEPGTKCSTVLMDVVGLQGDSNCNASQRLQIGGIIYATCNGGANPVAGSFADVNNNGGTFRSEPTATPSEICAGQNVYLAGYNNTKPTGLTYLWELVSSPAGYILPSDFNKNSRTNTLNLNLDGIYVFSLEVSKQTKGSNIKVKENVTIKVYPNLTAKVAIASPSNVVCAGTPTSLTFTATPTNGGAAPVYQWKLNGVNVGTNSPSFTSATLNAGDAVSVVMTSSATPCLSGSPVTSTSITITNQTVIFTGTGWDFTPTANLSAEIRSAFSSGTNDLNFCSLKVTSLAPVVINTGGSFTVQNGVTVDIGSTLTVQSDANLIQVNNTGNTGNIIAQRVIKVGALRDQYNYLGTPVNFASGETFKTIYPRTTFVLYHNEANNMFYNSSGVNIPGRGLAIKEPTGSIATDVTATFKGVPQNGIITLPIVNNNTGVTTFGYNLVGNPYPSNIDLLKIYDINGGKTGALQVTSPNISSTFYFWDNNVNTSPSQEGNDYSGRAYAIFNVLAGEYGTGTVAGSLNGGPLVGSKTPTNIVKVGQGFMIRSLKPSYSFLFNNSIRIKDYSAIDFLGKKNSSVQDDRYWLNMITPQNIASNIAVVYFEEGNNGFAEDDSRTMGGSDVVYSIVENENVSINGRSNFVNTDVIPLGTQHYAAGNYTIALGEKEGIFSNGQIIYLKDKQTGTITNLSEGSYTFSANAGVNTGRFEIVYVPETVLATNGDEKENVIVYRDGNDFVVKAQNKKITSLEVYDTAGRLILQLKPNNIKVLIPADNIVNGVYILKINQNGTTSVRKLLK